MKATRRKLMLAGAMAPLVMGGAGRAMAQAAGFYKDKVIIINVAGGASGGHTRYARMLQPYLLKHSGAKDVRIVLMPGGGGLKAANYVWRVKPNGLELFFGNVSTLILAPLAGSAGAQAFDPVKFSYLGRVTSEPRVLTVGGKSAIKSIQDVQKLKRPFVFPSQGTDEDFYTMAVLGDALGFKIKAVTGPIRSGDKNPILMVTSLPSPDYPGIPVITAIAPAAKRATVQAMATILETHRSYIGPPNMDPQAVAAFRAVVTAALKDPELLAESKKGERPVAPLEGALQQKQVAELAKASANLESILKAAVKEIQ